MIVEIAQLSNGAHRNQSTGKVLEGWAVIPPYLETPNFPFGDISIEEINGVQTVTAWEPLPIPDPEPEQPAQIDRVEAQATYTAMMTDTLLEE